VCDVSNAAIEEKMKSWICQAHDRDGGRMHRYAASEARKRQRLSEETQQPSSEDDY